MKVLIGADPELFLKKDGQFFSAHKMIPGTKTKPFPVEKGAVQVDGLALEFNIDPAETFEEFNNNINTVLKHLRSMVPDDYVFDFSATAKFTKEHMEAQLPEALILGCEPYYSAYSGNTPVAPPKFGKLDRAAGGHIHIGWGEGFDVGGRIHIESCARLARQLDCYIGIPSVLMDKDNDRRMNYGKPGTFRPKAYGMEYRTLSNFWVDKPQYRKFVFDQTKLAVDDLLSGKEAYETAKRFQSSNPYYVIIGNHLNHAKTYIENHAEMFKGFPG